MPLVYLGLWLWGRGDFLLLPPESWLVSGGPSGNARPGAQCAWDTELRATADLEYSVPWSPYPPQIHQKILLTPKSKYIIVILTTFTAEIGIEAWKKEFPERQEKNKERKRDWKCTANCLNIYSFIEQSQTKHFLYVKHCSNCRK